MYVNKFGKKLLSMYVNDVSSQPYQVDEIPDWAHCSTF